MVNANVLLDHASRYAAMNCSQPLKITASFASTPAGYDFPHLDNLLAKAIVNEATRGRGLPPSAEPYWLPLPLTRGWTQPDTGLPLWHSTDFLPCETFEKEAAYWHKRTIHPQWIQRVKGRVVNLRGSEGQDKEYRIPLPRSIETEWVAFCQGNLDEIGRLLAILPAVGKKTTQGHGAMRRFFLEPVAEFAWVRQDIALRPLPVGVLPSLVGNAYVHGWTPPYWLPATQCLAYPAQSRLVFATQDEILFLNSQYGEVDSDSICS